MFVSVLVNNLNIVLVSAMDLWFSKLMGLPFFVQEYCEACFPRFWDLFLFIGMCKK